MQFDLINAQDTTFAFALPRLGLLDVLLQFVQMMHSVVRHADGPYFAGFDGFGQRFPCTESGFFAAVWGVQEV